jgi:hypothetical protein
MDTFRKDDDTIALKILTAMITEISNSAVLTGAFNKKGAIKKLRAFYVRWFFVGMAIVFPIVAASGFVPDYSLDVFRCLSCTLVRPFAWSHNDLVDIRFPCTGHTCSQG